MDEEFIYLALSKAVQVRELWRRYLVLPFQHLLYLIEQDLSGIICKGISLNLLKINFTGSSGSCMDESPRHLSHGNKLFPLPLQKLFLKERLLFLHLQRYGPRPWVGLKGNPVQIGSYPRSCK